MEKQNKFDLRQLKIPITLLIVFWAIAISQALDANVYFAHPQVAWERGTNENANGLIRQYFPKGTDFASLTDSNIDRVMLRLNHRPQKCLGVSSPDMVFFQEMKVALMT